MGTVAAAAPQPLIDWMRRRPLAPATRAACYALAVRRYAYVGPAEIRERVSAADVGRAIRSAQDLLAMTQGESLTFVVDDEGVLRVAHRRSEHVACAGGRDVLAAGELLPIRDGASVRVIEISNQSTGYCPEPSCWPAVARALDAAAITHPGAFTFEATFRRCPSCGERNLVKDGDLECAVCGAELPLAWNF
jgi:hypothetical protein